jgi:hypothetical protein
LVVSDVHERRAEPLVQLRELASHVHPELGIQIGERLVHQEGARLANHGAPERDALALPARKLGGTTVEKLLNMELACGRFDLLVDLRHDPPAAPRQEPKDGDTLP